MKKDDPTTPAPPKHLHDRAPTVIHDPTQDETILARWLRQGMEKGPIFWLLIAGAVLVVFALTFLSRGLTGGRSAEAQGWESLILAWGSDNPVETQLKVGEEGVGEAAPWALLQAAESRYLEAFSDLPRNRAEALPLLTESHDLFEQTYKRSPADSPRRRLAAMGMARTLEARGDLDGAIRQYQAVVKEFPDTLQAERAQQLISELQKPENREFYQQFASFKPDEMTLPPGGTGIFDNLPAGLPGLDDALTLPPALPDLGSMPAPGDSGPETPASEAPALEGTSAPPTPSAETPAPGLPVELFAPGAGLEPPAPGTPGATPAAPIMPDRPFAPETSPGGEPSGAAPKADGLPNNPFAADQP